MRRLVVFLLCLLALPAVANAHAIVLVAQPMPGTAVAGDRIMIDLRFNTRIDAARSRMILQDKLGHDYPVMLSAQRESNLLSGVALGIPAGDYRIRWLVLATDGHITRGDIPLTVLPIGK